LIGRNVYNFNFINGNTAARAGELLTAHGIVPTPVFLPVGTQATVKTLTPDELTDIGYKMLLSNTYHLYLRPGMEVLRKMGGLHKFMGWNGAILTDSGGYQVFSLSALRKIDDNGVTFRSHIDGSTHLLTPELAVAYQEIIGSDVAMALDECTPTGGEREKVEAAMRRTHSWAARCLRAHQREDQALFAITQGGVFPELRRESAAYLASLDFPGYAIGGLCLGEPKEVMLEMVSETVSALPPDKARYLMGVGSPEDIVEGVTRGVDVFDCALPTRVARNGALFTWQGRRNIKNSVFREMEAPIESACDCYTCRNFSAAYLHHLFIAEEILGLRLATIHNLAFIASLMKKLRTSIIDRTFDVFRREFLDNYAPTNEETRINQKQKWLKAREIE
jgi:queuine tRNA-ribosyltransferase